MIEKSNIEVTLLSRREVEAKSKILQKVGRRCNRPYWTNEPSYFSIWSGFHGFFVTTSGHLVADSVNVDHGVRPVLKSDNLEELIKNLKKTYEDDIEVVEFGQYPDLESEIDIPDNVSLKPTGKIYYYPARKGLNLDEFGFRDYPEYEYNDQKFIKRNGTYYPVKLVKFYVDRENTMLISKNILFNSPINLYKKDYNGHFETSQLYDFLNNEFIKTLMSDNINDKDIVDMHEDTIQKLESEKQRLEASIQRKEELLKQIRILNLENEGLDAKIEDQILSKEDKGHPKTYHL